LLKEYLLLSLKTVFVYLFLLVSLRVMGKREIGKLSVFDLVVSIMIAEVAAVSLDMDEPMMRGLTIVALFVALQILVAYLSLKSHRLRQLVEGRPTFIIKDGKINDREMRSTRYTMSDLMTQLREKNIASVSDVEVALLETTGKLSVFPREGKLPVTREDLGLQVRNFSLPTALIVDGNVMEKNLHKINKDKQWLEEEIGNYGYQQVKDIFFCSIDFKGQLYFDKKHHDKPKQK
jgi:uncharacterized membrane protein YcaP (DUF421 family)